MDTVEPGILSHWFISKKLKFWTLRFASNEVFWSLNATTMSSYTVFGYWGHFSIFEKLGLRLGRVFSVIWGVIALWSKLTGHSVRCRGPTPPSPAFDQKLIAQMQWLTLGEGDCWLNDSQKLAMGQPNSR